MLQELRVRDFAIIEDLHLVLGGGFIVFTGETGAGKSIIIDAMEMLLGGRADSTAVRAGADAALIEGIFALDEAIRPEVHRLLQAEDLLEDPTTLILSREIRREGRNICRINGRVATLGLLSSLGEWLVDVHGQSEHLSLRRVSEHINLLDRFAHLEEARARFQALFRDLRHVREELAALRQQEQELAQRADYLRYQIQEIEAARLQPDEEQGLLEERNRLANAERLARLAVQALEALDSSQDQTPGARDMLGQAAVSLDKLAQLDSSMEALHAEAQALIEGAGELARRLRLYQEALEFNPGRLDEVEERLALISDLKRKYGGTLEQVIAREEQARHELENLTNSTERMAVLASEEASLLERLAQAGQELSEARREAGARLSAAIEAQLEDLRMQGARFGLDIRWEEDPQGAPIDGRRVALTPSGLDRVEFLVAPNPGEGLKPLAKIASGGEASRLMLGLKSVLAQADHTPTLIFDEIDQGIGGRVGAVVGQKLWALARAHQVLCITHLPQLAAFGDSHFRVEKVVRGGRTITHVQALAEQERIVEMAVMLGGNNDPNRQSAAELLRAATQIKAQATG